MFFANNINGDRISIDKADKHETYYCPKCQNALVVKKGNIKSPHFSHRPNCSCDDNWYDDNSESRRLFNNRFENDEKEVLFEKNGKKHFADIYQEKFERVIEYYNDNISENEFDERNAFFIDEFHKSVLWVFDVESIGKNVELISNNALNSQIKWNSKRFLRRSNLYLNQFLQIWLYFKSADKIFRIEKYDEKSKVFIADKTMNFDDFKNSHELSSKSNFELNCCHTLDEIFKHINQREIEIRNIKTNITYMVESNSSGQYIGERYGRSKTYTLMGKQSLDDANKSIWITEDAYKQLKN